MSFVSSQQSRVLIGDYHFSPVLTDFEFMSDTDMPESTTLNDAAKMFIPSLQGSSFNGSGWLDTAGAANAHLDQLNDFQGVTAEALTWAQSGTTLGAELVMVAALESQFMVGSKVASISEFSLSGQTDGATDFGRSLHELQARTTSSQETGYDNSALTSNGGVAHLHVTAFSGFSGVAVTVEHAPDNATWATLATFTSATALTQQRLAVAAATTVNRYLRAKWVVTGSGSISFQCGFARR